MMISALQGDGSAAWYVVEGTDGSGKSTAADMIASMLRSEGRQVAVITHPGRDRAVGRMELRLLKKDGRVAEVLSVCFFMIDILTSVAWMRGRDSRGYDDVIFVRYGLSVAYLPKRFGRIAHRMFTGFMPEPDISILVDADPTVAMARIGSRGDDREVYESVEKLSEVRERMLSMSEGWAILDNSSDVEHLRRQVENLIGQGRL